MQVITFYVLKNETVVINMQYVHYMSVPEVPLTREVTAEDKLILQRKESTYKEQCVSDSSIVPLRVENVSLIVENADNIFSVDVIKYASIWTFSIAMSILDIINR